MWYVSHPINIEMPNLLTSHNRYLFASYSREHVQRRLQPPRAAALPTPSSRCWTRPPLSRNAWPPASALSPTTTCPASRSWSTTVAMVYQCWWGSLWICHCDGIAIRPGQWYAQFLTNGTRALITFLPQGIGQVGFVIALNAFLILMYRRRIWFGHCEDVNVNLRASCFILSYLVIHRSLRPLTSRIPIGVARLISLVRSNCPPILLIAHLK